MTSAICLIFVGGIFLLTAFLKALSLSSFVEYLSQYRWLKSKAMFWAIFLIAYESILGFCLMIRKYPESMALLAMISLLCFSIWSFVGLKVYKIKDCACYGGALKVTPAQSIKLNFIYILILMVSFLEQGV